MRKKSFTDAAFWLVVLAVLAYLWFPGKSHQVLWHDAFLQDVFSPVHRVFNGVSVSVNSFFTRYAGFQKNALENVALREEVESLKIENLVLREQLTDQIVEQSVLQMQNHFKRSFLPVEIVSQDLFVPSKSVVINAGREQGVVNNAVVLSSQGLVGRVVAVFDDTSRVLLLTDPHFRVDAMSVKTKNRIMVRGVDSDLLWGKGYPLLTQTEFLLHQNAFQIGEELVTSGFGGIYPEGIPVGRVVKLKAKTSGLFSDIDILPANDFGKMLQFYVMLP